MSTCWYWLFVVLLLQCFYCQEENIEETPDANIIDENTINNGTIDEEEYTMSPEMENLYLLLNRMYSAVTHGDSRYFNVIIKQLSNSTYSDLILSENLMEAMESNFVHILNTMHLVSEISIKIHASPMQINNMNDGLFLILKSMVKYLKKSKLNKFISDDTYSDYYSASFVNLLFCEGISLSLQFRLIKTLKYLLLPSIMNNTEQYYCFDTYHNIINQTFFHLATKSRASGFVRLFFHLPTSLPVMKHLHINNKGLLKIINRNNPIVNQEMIKKRLSDIDVLIILKATFKLNLPNQWYLRKDINNKSAFDLWIKRSPYYLQNVYYHSAISKLFSTHHRHYQYIDIENNTCISMQYIAKYWPLIQWFPIPTKNKEKQTKQTVINDHNIVEVNEQNEFDDIFKNKWFQQQPIMFRNGIYDKWNLSDLTLSNLSDIFVDDMFITSNIPYQELYDDDYIDEAHKAKDREKRSINFHDFTEKYFGNLQTANLEIMCNELKQKKKKKKKKDDLLDISYIFDNNVYWKNNKFSSRFNVSDLIPKYIYNLMQRMIDDYNYKFDLNDKNNEEDRIEFDLNEIIENIIMLKQVAIGGIFSGAQPHFHGPAFNALLMGQKQWIIFPPNKSFQMKQTGIEFFCYHHNLSNDKKANLTYYTFIQNVGDVVFIPHEWAHSVLNMQPSIAVAVELFV